MAEWELYIGFTVELFSLVGIMLLAWGITKKLFGDFNEDEALKNAEWIIMEHCNNQCDCKGCCRYIVEENKCMYKILSPWRWKEGQAYEVRREDRDIIEVQGCREERTLLQAGSGTVQSDSGAGENPESHGDAYSTWEQP